MTYSRYTKRRTVKNDLEQYEDLLEKKEVPYINHYSSPQNILDATKQNFAYSEYMWQPNDRLYKLAQKYYGDPKLWWVFVQRNMEVIKDPIYDFVPGTKIYIPKDSNLKKFLGV